MWCELCNGDHVEALDIELADVGLIDAGDVSNVTLFLRITELRYCPILREYYHFITDDYNEYFPLFDTLSQ